MSAMSSNGRRVWVRSHGGENAVPINIDDDDTVYDLAQKVKKEYGLKGHPGLIDMYTLAAVSGGKNIKLEFSASLLDLTSDHLVYAIRKPPPKKGDIIKKCCGQNILFIGSSGHGKSATINTISRVLGDKFLSTSQTYENTHQVRYRKNNFNMALAPNEYNFNIWEVPGHEINGDDKSSAATISKRVEKLLYGGVPDNKEVRKYKKRTSSSACKSRRVHAVVYIQDGRKPISEVKVNKQTTELVPKLVMNAVTHPKDGVPGLHMFGVITNIDNITPEEFLKRKDELRTALGGIDEHYVIGVANTVDEAADQDRDRHMKQLMYSVLSAGYIIMEPKDATPEAKAKANQKALKTMAKRGVGGGGGSAGRAATAGRLTAFGASMARGIAGQ